ncbi:ras-related protein RABA5c-like [Rutidosis leptorrhynchoides]|uniref:ras-related protein RABA5c-like n=1 Tax=Rutidosis leptorrhynchoides TaxID=125765 RepID=UPI003A991778
MGQAAGENGEEYLFKIVVIGDSAVAHCDTTMARMLVGNKSDLEHIRAVSVEEGRSLAEEDKLFFIETSALDSTNVTMAFEVVIRAIYENIKRKVLISDDSSKSEVSLNGVSLVRDENTKQSSCCST